MRVNSLKDRTVGVDGRFLKRRGIGISRYLAQSVVELVEAGAQVTLILDDPHWCADLQAEYPGATIAVVPGRTRFLWEQVALWKHLRHADYDVFIAPANYGLPLGYWGRTKLVLVIHDVIPLRLPRLNLWNSPVWAAFYLVSTAIAIVKAQHIVTVSESSARDIARLLHRHRISVVYPQIDQLHADERAAGESPEVDLGDYFVYNGGADPRKNVPMLLRALGLVAKQLPSAQLVILGTGYVFFEEMIESLGIRERVHLLGYVSESRKTQIISHAIALVYPSSYEGFGMPLIEGMAAGIPVVSGTGGSLAEVGGSAVIYVQPLNEVALAAAMVEAAREAARDRARIAGRERLAELGRRQQETRLPDVLAGLLEDGSAAAPSAGNLEFLDRSRRISRS